MRRLLIAALLALAACSGGGDDSAETPETTTTEGRLAGAAPTTTPARGEPSGPAVTVAGGEVSATEERLSVDRGEVVRFSVTSDVADEVHVHGYEVIAPVAAGETITVEFTADLAGVWEVELEGAGLHLLEIEVS